MSEIRPLRRVSSLVLNSSPASPRKTKGARGRKEESQEEVPDSEEERLMFHSSKKENYSGEIIEISSDEEVPMKESTANTLMRDEDNPFLGRSPHTQTQKKRDHLKSPRHKLQTARSRRIVYSSSSEESDTEHEVVQIRKASNKPAVSPSVVQETTQESTEPASSVRAAAAPAPFSLSVAEDEPWNVNDGSILILDEPRSARKPIRPPAKATTPGPSTPLPLPLKQPRATASRADKVVSLSSDEGPVATPTLARTRATPSAVIAKTLSNASPSTRKRPSKKAEAAARAERLQAYAVAFFDQLNKTIFNSRLPDDTKLIWSPRLTSTAGKANWHRTRDGVEMSEVQLSRKILTSEERVRNTLAHEMCHLAAWIINREPSEGHGPIWKAWVAKVTKKRPDIEVTTKHHYDIEYPFTWECEQCNKIYGRFSKSINADRCVCGVCQIGKLIPQFTTRPPRTPKTNAGSRLAAEISQGSPHVLRLEHTNDEDVGVGVTSTLPPPGRRPRYSGCSIESDGDNSDIEELTIVLDAVRID